MQDFFSILPFLIFLASAGFLILVGANIFLCCDLRRMRREQQEGDPSIWYRRSRVRRSLKWIGYAVLLLLLAFGWGAISFLPRSMAIISGISMFFIILSINVVIASSRLVRDLRNQQWEQREGFPSIWYQRPKFLRLIGQVLFWCGPLLSIAYVEYMLLAQDIFHQPLLENTAPIIIIPGVFFLFSAAFYLYSLFQGMLNRRSY